MHTDSTRSLIKRATTAVRKGRSKDPLTRAPGDWWEIRVAALDTALYKLRVRGPSLAHGLVRQQCITPLSE